MTTFDNVIWFIVGSLIRFLKSLLVDNKFNNANEFFSIESSWLASCASSYKAKEYLLAEVVENAVFLLNWLPISIDD